ncbi:hypothetical protein EV426DRAFT_576511 [Tirmania nivea]|nr:hypothetical protein EV426DRAFT_576511 [Tirmania nivea]
MSGRASFAVWVSTAVRALEGAPRLDLNLNIDTRKNRNRADGGTRHILKERACEVEGGSNSLLNYHKNQRHDRVKTSSSLFLNNYSVYIGARFPPHVRDLYYLEQQRDTY